MNLYRNIKYLREKLGLSQEELAHRVGYKDRTSIAKIEGGKIDIPQSKISAFAKALNTTPIELMGWDEKDAAGYYTDPEVAQMANDLKDDPQMRILLDAKKNLSKEEMESIINIAKMMLKKDGKDIDE